MSKGSVMKTINTHKIRSHNHPSKFDGDSVSGIELVLGVCVEFNLEQL
jgi:hypothetical protein